MLFVIYQAFVIRNGISLSEVGTCSATILLAIALALQLFFNACTTSILEILNKIAQAVDYKDSRLEMIVFQSNVIKGKRKKHLRGSEA